MAASARQPLPPTPFPTSPSLLPSPGSKRAAGLRSPLPELAMLCCGTPLAVETHEWPRLIREALRHGVAPLLALRARDYPLPAEQRTYLNRIYKESFARNWGLSGEMSAVLALLERSGVRALALKGPELAERLYGDIAARQVTDLDFLIRPEDLARVDAALESAGFARPAAGPIARFHGCRDVLYRKRTPEGRAIYLDVHMRLRPYGTRDALASVLLQEGLTPEHLLLYLCLNVVTHRFARLLPWLDLIAFVQRESPRLDWTRVEDLARRLEWTHGVYWCLRYCTQIAEMSHLETRGIRENTVRRLAPRGPSHKWVTTLLGAGGAALLERMNRLDGPRGTLATLACERGALPKLALAGAMAFPRPISLRQMDAPRRARMLPAHYAERLARKLAELIRPKPF